MQRAKASVSSENDVGKDERHRWAVWQAGRFVWLWLILLGVGQVPLQGQSVLFNEVMYHPPSTNLLEEWFELYNPGANAIDLSGWQITKGVQFSFVSNTVLSAGSYLVVAADRATFTNKHPTVTNFVAGWIGDLGHSLELSDNTGQVINSIQFYNDGDWAVQVMGPVMYNHQGWESFAAHDGLGSSLELKNPALPNTYAHNWGSSTITNGTPGRANSIASTNVAPFIAEVAHSPVIPQPSDVVTVSARIVDERTNGLTVTLNYRVDGTASFTAVPMFDDGAHGDGVAGDGIYAAILPAQPNATVVEFFLQARDLEGNVRAYPSYVPPVPPANTSRTANLLYQVDNGVYAGDQPIYRIIMREIERADLYALGRTCPDSDSDAAMNATWITVDGVVTGGTTTQLRYNVGVRNRGHGSRQANPNNYHVNIPSDRQWKKQTGINLNSQYTHSQILGSAVHRRLELPMADSRAVQVRVNSTNLMVVTAGTVSFGSYAANEQYNNDFIKRSFPLDPGGNSYRGIRNSVLCDGSKNGVADLAWHGSDPTVPAYALAYFKQNNPVQNDWSDLISLIGVLNVMPGYSSPATYVADVQRVLNVDAWMRYMAADTLFDNQETDLANGIGDDYALYRGTNDTRFLALPYDLDSLMGIGQGTFNTSDSLFRMTALPVLDRLVKTPEFAPIYYKNLKTLAETVFSPAEMNVLLDQMLNTFVTQATINSMKSFNAARISYVLSQIPLSLSVTSSLPLLNGYPHAASATAALFGMGNVIDTRTILVNGSTSSWTAWQGTWTNNSVALVPGINRVRVQALDTNGLEIARTSIDLWYDVAPVTSVSGTLAASTAWTAAGGPYNVSGNLIIPNGLTLTIQPGTTVYVASLATITVNGTGRLLAQGTETQRIHIGRNPAVAGNWGSLDFMTSTVESRLAYVDFDSCGGTTASDGHNAQVHVNSAIVFIDHCTWPPTPVVEYISFNGSSFVVQNCIFPSYPPPTGPESLHGINGIPNGGYGIFRDNYFGHTWGFNDTIDFTGGNRPGPILQFINNVFDGASDDCLDLDSTDAWIEGNVFMHVHRDPTRTDDARDTGSAISGGVDFVGQNSDWTIINNLFYDVDHVVLNKGNSTTTGNGGGRVVLLYNTVVHVAKENSGSPVSDIAAFDWSDDGIALPDANVGSGLYAAHNILYDCAVLNKNYDPAHHTIIMENNILPVGFKGTTNEWAGAGGGNQYVDPRLNLSIIASTPATNVTAAQLREACRLLPGSPAFGAGFGRRNLGGLNSNGIAVAGEAAGTTTLSSATLTVGPSGTLNWGTTTPQPWGWKAFKWKLDGGAWSAEIPVTNPSPFTNPAAITLSSLSNGPHTVFVSGKNDAGYYQDDPFVYAPTSGVPAHVTASRTWTVNTGYSRLLLNEILAKNNTVLTNGGTTPDLIELYNDSLTAADLSGMGLTDDPLSPYKFTFPPGTTNPPGGFLVLYADASFALPGIHLGFSFKPSGGSVFLFASANAGGALLDSVVFGIQVPDFSIGRLPDGSWGLCKPTFGTNNVAQTLGDARTLKINEWLADAQFVANNDFIELYNPDTLPVALGGLYLSDSSGSPGLNPILPLSFIAGQGFTSFVADGQPEQGADHVNFKLSPDVGLIILSAADLGTIDVVSYGPQHTDVSQGRSPNGGDSLSFFAQATPGGGNPGNRLPAVVITTNINCSGGITNFIAMTNFWRLSTNGSDQGIAWRAKNFDDTNTAGWIAPLQAPFYHGTLAAQLPIPPKTTLPFSSPTIQWTFYFRTHFTVTNPNPTGLVLTSSNLIDDGAVFYINGQEAYRQNMPSGAITNSTPASPTTISTATLLGPYSFPATNLVQGDNVMAVEVHQANLSSSDICLAMNLYTGSPICTTNYTTNFTGSTDIQVVLNEILANNKTLTNGDGSLSDWVELFNPATNAIDISDTSLTDDPSNPRKWVFPSGATMTNNGYRVVYFNEAAPASSTNTGFGFKASGDSLYLFDRPANGGGLLDALTFGLQTPDFSVGRVPNGSGGWQLTVASRGAPNVAAGLGNPSFLRINEWMADPPAGSSDWFEIYNTAGSPVALGGLFLTDNLADKTQSPIQPLSFIGAGANAFVQFFADGGVGNDHVKFNLKKSGEQIGIFSPIGKQLDGLSFGSQLNGVSQGRFPDGGPYPVSFVSTPSPAESNYLPLTNAVVNEVLTHTDPPLEDAIELFNPSAVDAGIGGWFLSDTKDNFKKYRIPDGLTLPAMSYSVFYETQFNTGATAFTLNSAHGDSVILSQADGLGNLTGYRARVDFGAAENGVSFGRYQTSVGVDFTALSARTFGQDSPATVAQFRTGTGLPNAGPKVGPVVVNEIMYHPITGSGLGAFEDSDEEYIELRNTTPGAIPLFDPNYSTNTWRLRGAVDFDFPTNLTVAADGFILVVPFEPANSVALAGFRARYNVSPSVPVFGPWTGRLNNAGDHVDLYKPDAVQLAPHPDAGFVPYILVDRVAYKPGAPWPPGANGTSNSLQRIDSTAYGNDPVNWLAATPTAGRATAVGFVDTDGDGMDDNWEWAYFGTLARNGSGDYDADGMTDLEEYRAGTNPLLASSNLKLVPVSYDGNHSVLSFTAVAGRTYRIQYSTTLYPGSWVKLVDVPSQSVTGPFQVTDFNAQASTVRFYRIVTPAGP